MAYTYANDLYPMVYAYLGKVQNEASPEESEWNNEDYYFYYVE